MEVLVGKGSLQFIELNQTSHITVSLGRNSRLVQDCRTASGATVWSLPPTKQLLQPQNFSAFRALACPTTRITPNTPFTCAVALGKPFHLSSLGIAIEAKPGQAVSNDLGRFAKGRSQSIWALHAVTHHTKTPQGQCCHAGLASFSLKRSLPSSPPASAS